MNAADATCVLRGQSRDDGGAVDAERRERLQVGLDAGATRRIRAGDSERDRYRHRLARKNFSGRVKVMALSLARGAIRGKFAGRGPALARLI